MIVEPREPAEADGHVESAARVRWRHGDTVVRVRAPAELADRSNDLSGFLALTLPLALRSHEDLEVRGPVSPVLLDRADAIQRAYLAMDPHARPAAVSVEKERAPQPEPSRRRAAFFSRGVDSSYAAAHDRPDLLVFVDGLEPLHDADVRREEIRRARRAAESIGLGLAVVETDVRTQLTDRLVADWEDMVGAGLAFLAHALSGGLDRILIPSGDTFATIEPCGTSPLLDPLFSTERLAIEHDALALSRREKVGWLAENRPELIEHLKVCFAENRPDNCGRCGKCLLTMTCLQLAGALPDTGQFPDTIDPEAIRRLRMRRVASRRHWLDAAGALGPQDAALREAVLARLRATRLPGPGADGKWVDPVSLRDHRLNAVLSLIIDGRPYPRGAENDRGPGLVRVVDRRAGRHVHGIGRSPAGEPAGELGALHRDPEPDSLPVWLSDDGRLVTEDNPKPRHPARRRFARWALAPLGWRGEPLRPRLGALAWRLRHTRPAAPPPPPGGPPAAHLHLAGGAGRVPLYGADHPVTGDQLLTTWPWEAVDLGYGRPRLLGYLEARAPVTGQLGTLRPLIPWGSRLGRRIRPATPPSTPPSG